MDLLLRFHVENPTVYFYGCFWSAGLVGGLEDGSWVGRICQRAGGLVLGLEDWSAGWRIGPGSVRLVGGLEDWSWVWRIGRLAGGLVWGGAHTYERVVSY